MHILPETGYLRLVQIIGREGITEAQARANARRNEEARKRAIAQGRLDQRGHPIFNRLPSRERPPLTPLVPVSKSSWWAGIKLGRYRKPVKIGERMTAWRVEDIRALISQAGKQGERDDDPR
jgi:predicted DNA-binding transcriptional regulator AlpA